MKLYGDCPKCKAGVLVPRQSKFGFFLGCSKFPTCDYNQKITVDVHYKVDENGNLKPQEQAKQELVGRDCPDCGQPLVYRVSKKRRSKFIGCSAFPKCKHIENIPKETQEPTKE
jgi:DNA topoisomerase-1